MATVSLPAWKIRRAAQILKDNEGAGPQSPCAVNTFNAAIDRAVSTRVNGDRHKPGYMAEYMRQYRKRKKATIDQA